jgi:hypothetical protein
MTDRERREEGAEEAIEDLEAPAQQQDEVAGGVACGPQHTINCYGNTCTDATAQCMQVSQKIVLPRR